MVGLARGIGDGGRAMRWECGIVSLGADGLEGAADALLDREKVDAIGRIVEDGFPAGWINEIGEVAEVVVAAPARFGCAPPLAILNPPGDEGRLGEVPILTEVPAGWPG